MEGFKIVVTRVFKQGGAEVKREDVKTSYNAANKIYCRAAPAPAPAPAAPVAPVVASRDDAAGGPGARLANR